MVLALITAPATVWAQREYTIGLTANLVSGGDSNPQGFGGGSGGQSSDDLRFFYGVFPSINMTSEGARSSVNLSYSFGLERTDTDPRLQSESHGATFGFSKTLSPTWSMSYSDTFQMTSDIRSFDAFQGVVTDPDQFDYLFNPVAADISARSNDVALQFEHQTGPRSTIEFNGAHNLRKYANNSFTGVLSNQQSISGGFGFSRLTGPTSSWNAGYRTAYTGYQDFDSVLSHSGYLGFSTEIVRELTFQLSGGPTYVTNRGIGGSYLGYNAAASIRRQVAENSLAVYYSAQSGASSGLGSTSDTRRAGVSLSHPQAPLDIFLDVSVFDTRGRLDNLDNLRGASAAARVGYPLTDAFSLQVGAQYQKYTRTSTFAYDQERLYLSLTYRDPDVWAFFK